jgi:hypothetical protein
LGLQISTFNPQYSIAPRKFARANTEEDIRGIYDLLLLEAGGKVTTIRYPNSKPLSIYSNDAIHETIKKLLIPEKEQRKL